MTEKCLTCKFFLPDKNPTLGLCRRYPAFWSNDERGFAFPIMKVIGWCGEYKSKDNPNALPR